MDRIYRSKYCKYNSGLCSVVSIETGREFGTSFHAVIANDGNIARTHVINDLNRALFSKIIDEILTRKL